MATPERRSLADLAAESGTPVPCAGNLPLDLGDPGFAWFIERGAVDLFLVESREGAEQSAPQHVLRAAAGRLLPGVAPQEEDTTFGLIVKGLPGTLLRRLPVCGLADVANAELAVQVDAWLADVSAMLSRGVGHRPRPDALVEPGEAVAATEGTLSARRGVVWVSAPPPGTGLFLSLIDPVESRPDGGAAPGTIPLTSTSWLTLIDEVQLSARSSEALADENVLLPDLASFHATAFALERLNRRLAVVDQANLERARATNRRTDEEGARHRLFDLYGLSREAGAGAPAARRCSKPSRSSAVTRGSTSDGLRSPTRPDPPSSSATCWMRPESAADGSGSTPRTGGGLATAARCWRSERTTTGPVALLPGVLGRYREVDPVARHGTRMTAERAESLRADAWMFYRPLPNAGVGPRDLLRIARQGLTAKSANSSR